MNEDFLYSMEQRNIPPQFHEEIYNLCQKFSESYVMDWLPFFTEDEDEKRSKNKIEELKNDLQREFLFSTETFSELENIICEAFGFHYLFDYILESEKIIEIMEEKCFIVIYEEKNKKYVVSRGRKIKQGIEELIKKQVAKRAVS